MWELIYGVLCVFAGIGFGHWQVERRIPKWDKDDVRALGRALDTMKMVLQRDDDENGVYDPILKDDHDDVDRVEALYVYMKARLM